MATKKITDEVVSEEVVAKVKEKKDPWKTLVTVQIPRANDGDSNYLFVSLNNKNYKIQRGVNVDVPAPVADMLQHSFEAQEEAIRFIDRVSN